jgi:hypothetical protein
VAAVAVTKRELVSLVVVVVVLRVLIQKKVKEQ